MMDMLEAFQSAIQREFTTTEQIELPARSERREPLPAEFRSGYVGRWLDSVESGYTLWTHQTEALRRFEAGANIVIATGTASGKSRIFQAAALRA